MADLEYELSIGRKLAMAGITDFVKEAQRELDKLKVDPYVSSSKSKSANKSGPNDMLKMFEDEERKRQKILKDSLNQIELIEIQMGRKLIEERRKTINELKALSADPSITPEQYRRNSALMVGQYRSDLTTDAASDRDEMSRRERELRDAQHYSERKYEIHQNALYRIEQIERSSGANLTRERQALETRIQSIIENSGGRRLSTINRIINGEIAAFNRLARSQQSGGVSGKNLQYVFQAQQAIEDFSYAGLRGASNNIALMASQLGGPAGLIALLGISAVQMGPMIAKLLDYSDATDISAQRTKSLNRSLADLLQVDTGNWWNDGKIEQSTQAVQKYQEAIEATRNKLDSMKQSEQKWQNAAGLLNSLTAARKHFWVMAASEAGSEELETQKRYINEIKQQILALYPAWNGQLETEEQINDVLKEIEEKLKTAPAEQAKLNKELQKQLEVEKQIVRERERRDKVQSRLGFDGTKDKFEPEDANEDANKKMLRKKEKDIKYWTDIANRAAELGNEQSAQDARDTANRLKTEYEAIKRAMEAVKDAQAEQLDTARDELRAAKERNAEAEQRLKHEQAISKEIENEHRRQRISNASDQLDTQQGMSNNALNRMKERDMRLVSMSPNQDWQRLMTHQIDQYYDHLQSRSDRFFAQQKNQQLQANAQAAAASGDHKESRSYLEQLKSHQQQQAMNARTPQEAQFWYNKSLETQKRIEESFQKQKAQQQEKIAGIREEIKSVEDLEKRVEQLSDKLRNTPKLDMQNPAVLAFLDNVDQKLQNILNKQQQMQQNAGGGGGGPIGTGPVGGWGAFGGAGGNLFGGGNPFGNVDWNGGIFGSGYHGAPSDSDLFVGGGGDNIDWNHQFWGGGAIPGGGPVGGWGLGGMSAGAPVPESGMTAALAGLPSPFSNYGGQSIVNNQNVSIGNMPIQISSSFDLNSVHASARHAASNNLLRRGA